MQVQTLVEFHMRIVSISLSSQACELNQQVVFPKIIKSSLVNYILETSNH